MNILNKILLFTVTLLACCWIALSQSRRGNWPTYGGDAQRSGWEGADAIITKDSVKDLQLLWKLKLETQSRGMRPVMPPVIQGRLISYRGFKELAFVATNSDIVYAIDADVGSINRNADNAHSGSRRRSSRRSSPYGTSGSSPERQRIHWRARVGVRVVQ